MQKIFPIFFKITVDKWVYPCYTKDARNERGINKMKSEANYIMVGGLYGENGEYGYYRKQGIYCFDLVWDKKLATPLSKEEAEHIKSFGPSYFKNWNAQAVIITD